MYFLYYCYLTVPFALAIERNTKKSKYLSGMLGALTAVILVIGIFILIRLLISAITAFPAWIYRFHIPAVVCLGGGALLAAVFIKTNAKKVKKTPLYLAGGMLAGAYAFITMMVFMLFDPGSYFLLTNYHYFNDHIKSLCVYREDKSDCPRTEENLASFNHARWNEFTSAGTVEYSFNPETGTYTFTAEDHRMKIYNTDTHPAYFDVTFY